MNRRDFLNYSILSGAALLVPKPLAEIVRPMAPPELYSGPVLEIRDGFTLSIVNRIDCNYSGFSFSGIPEEKLGFKTAELTIEGDKNRWMTMDFLGAALNSGEVLPFIIISKPRKYFGEFRLASYEVTALMFEYNTNITAVFESYGALKII